MSAARTRVARPRPAPVRPADAPDSDPEVEASLLDLVDHVLTKGVVLSGDVMLGVAGVDLVYLRLSAVLCAADRVLGGGSRAARGSSRRRRRR